MTCDLDTTSEQPVLTLTRHAVTRFDQRGIRQSDAPLIMAIGTEVEGGYLVRKTDIEQAEQDGMADPDHLRRLQGKRMVAHGGLVTTGYHASSRKARQLMKSRVK